MSCINFGNLFHRTPTTLNYPSAAEKKLARKQEAHRNAKLKARHREAAKLARETEKMQRKLAKQNKRPGAAVLTAPQARRFAADPFETGPLPPAPGDTPTPLPPRPAPTGGIPDVGGEVPDSISYPDAADDKGSSWCCCCPGE